MTIARTGLKVKVKIMRKANAYVGRTSIEGTLFSSCAAGVSHLRVLRSVYRYDMITCMCCTPCTGMIRSPACVAYRVQV